MNEVRHPKAPLLPQVIVGILDCYATMIVMWIESGQEQLHLGGGAVMYTWNMLRSNLNPATTKAPWLRMYVRIYYIINKS